MQVVTHVVAFKLLAFRFALRVPFSLTLIVDR
jgi:hypothetical protein